MAIFNGNKEFSKKRELSQPLVSVPKNVRQAFNIQKAYANGVFQLEPKKKETLYDRCYVFEDINYINKNRTEKKNFLSELMFWLNSMDASYMITLCNEYQSVEKFLASIRNERNEKEYPDIAKGIRQWQESKLADANSTVRTLRYLTITCRADSLDQANIYFRALEPMIEDAFAGWGSDIAVLGTLDRFRVLHGMLRPGEEFPQAVLRDALQDWKSDVLPRSIQQFNDYLILGDTVMTVLTATQYRKSLDTDTFLHTLSSLSYPSFVTLDFAPVQQEVINDKLVAMHMNNEREINDEIEQKRQAGQIVTSPSYTKKKRRDEIEEYIEMVDANDEKGVFLNLLVVLTTPVKEGVKLLQQRMEEVCAIGRSDKVGVFLEPCDFRQLKALNTALPMGGRQVDYMRFFLTSSLVAFNPYHAQDILEPGGKMLGINKTTGRYLIANRKLLPNPHGIIVGYSGSGKSMLIKLTEIAQTLLGSEDDILILDPQNEFEDICREYQGVYFDLTPKSGIYLNGFEVTQEVFSGSKELKAEFVAKQCEYAKGLVQAIMKNILVTQEHDSVVSRCTERMFTQVFAQKRLKKQPTLLWLREEIGKELEQVRHAHDEAIIRPIYNSLEEYTTGSCDMLAHPTNIEFQNRLVGFGMCNVPENNWEAVMDTVLHYLSTRMDYNKKLQKATHLVVDEAQVVSEKPGSAEMLNNAVITFRKFGGIVTLAMQNVVAALANKKMVELFQNCSYKCFLDQGGVDAQSLAEIQPLSEREFRALGTGKPGEGVIVWNKKVVLFNARIEKNNILYEKYSTNFHEKAQREAERSSVMAVPVRQENVTKSEEEPELWEERVPLQVAYKPEPEMPQNWQEEKPDVLQQGWGEQEWETVLQLAAFAPIRLGDVTALLEIAPEEAQRLLDTMLQAGVLEEKEGWYQIVE